jgi:hypothetical protein
MTETENTTNSAQDAAREAEQKLFSYHDPETDKIVSDYAEELNKIHTFEGFLGVRDAMFKAMCSDLADAAGVETLEYYANASPRDKALINQTLRNFCGYDLPKLVRHACGEQPDDREGHRSVEEVQALKAAGMLSKKEIQLFQAVGML